MSGGSSRETSDMNHSRKVFLSLYIAIFMSSLGLGILSPILPVYVDHFGVSSTVLGVVFGAYSASRTLFMPPVGYLSDRFGRRGFIVSGLLLFTLISPLYALAEGIAQLILVRFLQGMAAAMLMPVAMSYIGDLAPEGREGFLMGTFTSAFFAGLGFGPLIGGFLRDRYSMEAAFYGMGALSLMALISTAATLPPDGSASRQRREKQHGGMGKILSLTPRLWALLFFRFTRALGIGFVWVLMPLYAIIDLHVTSFQVGILLSVNTFVTTFLQSPLGHLSDRIGHLRSITLGSIAAALAVSAISWAPGYRELILISLVLGLAGALIVPSGSALAVELGRSGGMGRVMGLYSTSLSLGTMAGPVLGGIIADLWDIRPVFPLGGVLGIVGWGVLMTTYKIKSNTE
ncbi:MFS transporter [bacterium]|nr:MAG: MFS transporter [bacterium]